MMKKGLIYRQFTLRGKTSSQLVVPSSLTEKVMTGDFGIKKTIDSLGQWPNFWPGVCGDVTRFC